MACSFCCSALVCPICGVLYLDPVNPASANSLAINRCTVPFRPVLQPFLDAHPIVGRLMNTIRHWLHNLKPELLWLSFCLLDLADKVPTPGKLSGKENATIHLRNKFFDVVRFSRLAIGDLNLRVAKKTMSRIMYNSYRKIINLSMRLEIIYFRRYSGREW